MNWGGPEREGTGWDWRSAGAFAITAALRRAVVRERGGVAKDYRPLSFYPQGNAASYHSWTNSELDLYRMRTIVVEVQYSPDPVDEYDEPSWREWYGDGGRPKDFERKMSTDRWDWR
jgi:hypothetical protein